MVVAFEVRPTSYEADDNPKPERLISNATPQQQLSKHIQALATQYSGPDAEVYRTAAEKWRHPYWDWAVDKALPEAVVRKSIIINTPNGTATIPNPLRTYTFQRFPLDPNLFPYEEDSHLDSYPRTLRCIDPTTNTSNDGWASDYVSSIDLDSQVVRLLSPCGCPCNSTPRLPLLFLTLFQYDIYTRIHDFERMSTTGESSASIEAEHNEVHVAVGGLHPMGHFASLAYSGFDPLFMMHHAAIDRHVALWQTIYYRNSMFNSTYITPEGQFATAPGTNISANSPLKPFYKDAEGNFHTSNSAANITTFGYTYPELQGLPLSKEEQRRAVMGKVNRLYAPKAQLTVRAIRRRSPVHSDKAVEYFVEISVDKSELDLPSSVNIWYKNSFAGRVLLLAAPRIGLVHGEVALRRVLGYTTMNTSDSKEFERARERLRKDIRWDIRTVGEPSTK